ncbi:hypothetical protein QYM36_016844 [Artemia franciscana]|uniref:Ribosome biogenesis regulatory protein n=1 Tax=Artemia franciscana TaxID=6661 RepID=A0AA88HFP5_ARTSF|nr:hypothetical protein QYM36_016844 [Artemia franciscana]
MTDVIVSEVLQELSEKEELLQSIHVSKHLQPEVDLGNLLLNDLDEIDLGNIETNKEEYLLSLNRDNLQYLVNKLYELPTERVDEVIVAKIPEPILSYNGYHSNILGFFVKKNVAPSIQLALGGFKSVPENVEIACIIVQFFSDIGRASDV